jgi:hypothetical protein
MMAAQSPAPAVAPKAWTKGLSGFALASACLVALAAFGMTLLFRGTDEARTIWITAVIALATQIAAFPVVRRLVAQNLMVGWGIGTLVRFLTLGVYALVVVLAHLPVAPALLSLALFYFISSVIEPLFLRS